MSAQIIPLPAREFNMHEYLFGASPLSREQRFALADALERLAASQGRLADALEAVASTLESNPSDGGAK